jgi:hypothetical protein
MWTCSKCGEEVEDDFDVCWSCGTTKDGVENTAFNPETEGVLDERAYQADQDARREGNFVTVATFGSPPEAHMVRSRLEAEGISAVVMNELTGALFGTLLSPSNVLLQVAEKDADRARALLAEIPRLASESLDEEEHSEDGDDEYEDDFEEEEDDPQDGIKK